MALYADIIIEMDFTVITVYGIQYYKKCNEYFKSQNYALCSLTQLWFH